MRAEESSLNKNPLCCFKAQFLASLRSFAKNEKFPQQHHHHEQ
jgi:hypothetical protein